MSPKEEDLRNGVSDCSPSSELQREGKKAVIVGKNHKGAQIDLLDKNKHGGKVNIISDMKLFA